MDLDLSAMTILLVDDTRLNIMVLQELLEGMAPEQLVEKLNGIFGGFDAILDQHGMEKIKTLGDGYLCTGGVPLANETHAIDAVGAALAMQAFMRGWNAPGGSAQAWELSVGIHTGELVAGVIGTSRFAHDVWGETVYVAARLVDTAGPGAINVSSATWVRVADRFNATPRGPIPIKNMGKIEMFHIAGAV